ncbi:hypothetical protein ZWY2020_014598 [Hordeum vulgare]|nr:hypothetical protein ZWY2020_014598 [Hordeum vulgare]
MPLADQIRDHLGISFPCINLDGLVPPAPTRSYPPSPREAAAATVMASLTMEEARKVMHTKQMEAARVQVRASREGTVTHTEFLHLCWDAAGADDRPFTARALNESGSVIVLGRTVFLRPEMTWNDIDKITNFAYVSTYIVASSGVDITTQHQPAADSHQPSNTGPEWVDLFVREMSNASDMDDARARASRALEALTKSILEGVGAEVAQSLHQENMMLKEQMTAVMSENAVLKRAVAIQHEREKEFNERSHEVECVKQLVLQYHE